MLRIMLKVSIPTEFGNSLAVQGQLGPTIKAIMDELKPEAAYWAEENGRRTGFIFVHLSDSSEIPRVAEPFFLGLNASVEFHPAMNMDDLMKAGPHFERAVSKFGSRPAAAVAH